MNIKDYNISESLPVSLDRDNTRNVAKVIDEKLHEIDMMTELASIYPRIDELSSNLIDALAIQLHVDFYKTTLPLESRRTLVKNSILWHMKKGTKFAVEGVISAAFEASTVQEWFEYGGDPYHFKITTECVTTEKGVLDEIRKAVESVKNVRSWLDKIEFLLHLEDDAEIDVNSEDAILKVNAWFRDVVPYGRALDYPRYDGTHRVTDLYRFDGHPADGTLRCGEMLPGTLQFQEGIEWQFVYDGSASFDGTFQADGTTIANGERPWILQYNDFMDELSILIITMRKPDGTTELEDDVAFLPRADEGIRACGGARFGMTQSPVDNCGRLSVTRSHRFDGKVRANDDMNLADGSMLADGAFAFDGGGIHPRIDTYSDDLCGTLSLRTPKKHPPIALRYPELFEDIGAPTENDSVDAVLDDFEDSPGIDDKPFAFSGTFLADGSVHTGTGNILPVDTGGTLTIIHVLTADGTHLFDGGLSLGNKADGSLQLSGIQLKGGNQFGITRRHDEAL